jgi:superfamily II DNA or RNA helicase
MGPPGARVANLREQLAAVFSALFPRTVEIDLRIDAVQSGDRVYVDVRLAHKGDSYQISDFSNIPGRVKLGSRRFKISPKNRSTLKHLGDWDPIFDPRKGFTFYEKDVPEVLAYLRSKASASFSPAAARLRVDERPLEYVHDVQQKEQTLEISTALTDADSEVRIDQPGQAKFIDNSAFVHAQEGYFKKPNEKKYKSFEPTLGTTVLSGDQIPLFLLYDLKRLRNETRASVAPEVERQRVATDPFVAKVSVDIDGPWIWLDVRYQADRFNLPYSEVASFNTKQKFTRKDEVWLGIDRETHARLTNRIDKIPEVDRVDDRFRTPTRHYLEVQELFAAVADIDASEAYSRFLQSLQDFSKIEEQPPPYALRGNLRDYQKHGYNWLCFLRRYGLNGILADEMGLGKTVQALTTLLEAHSCAKASTSLIVCPPSVLSAWEDDARKFTSPVDFRIGRYLGVGRSHLLEELGQYDALLTTYTTVLKDIEPLSRVAWEYVILDEAQKIKNHETATAKACKRLIAKHKLALTGTPIENRLSELWSLYDFLMPSYLGPYNRFRENIEIPAVKRGDKKAIEGLKRRISPFKLRRIKKQVESQLPEKINMDRYCELTPEQVHLYKQFAADQQTRIKQIPGEVVKIDMSVLAAITRLKQICCHPALIRGDYGAIYGRSGKLEAFLEILDELVDNDEKALIFSQFTEMLGILRRILQEKGHQHFYLDGSTPEKERARMKTEFQEGDIPFFLISLRAGGLGMTLTRANCVVHYDRWWNPAVEDQATDRAHRIGLQHVVKVFRIHTVGTIEERIGELLVKKKDLFDSVIEADDLRKEITKAELLALFTPPK